MIEHIFEHIRWTGNNGVKTFLCSKSHSLTNCLKAEVGTIVTDDMHEHTVFTAELFRDAHNTDDAVVSLSQLMDKWEFRIVFCYPEIVLPIEMEKICTNDLP